MGRPRKFTPEEFKKAWEDYFESVDNNPWMKQEAIKSGDMAGTIISVPTARPYTEMGFCAFHNLGESFLRQLADSIEGKEDKKSREFSSVLTRARAKCYSQKFEGAAVGAFNANIIARDLGLVEKKELDHTTKGESINKKLSMEEAKQRLDELMNGKS